MCVVMRDIRMDIIYISLDINFIWRLELVVDEKEGVRNEIHLQSHSDRQNRYNTLGGSTKSCKTDELV